MAILKKRRARKVKISKPGLLGGGSRKRIDAYAQPSDIENTRGENLIVRSAVQNGVGGTTVYTATKRCRIVYISHSVDGGNYSIIFVNGVQTFSMNLAGVTEGSAYATGLQYQTAPILNEGFTIELTNQIGSTGGNSTITVHLVQDNL